MNDNKSYAGECFGKSRILYTSFCFNVFSIWKGKFTLDSWMEGFDVQEDARMMVRQQSIEGVLGRGKSPTLTPRVYKK
jgi:hypothetical protein